MEDCSQHWASILAGNTAQAEISIVVGFFALIFYVKYSKQRIFLDRCIGGGWAALVAYRIISGVILWAF